MTRTISAAMIVRDEEDGLERAIRSVQQLESVDEIVVVDTGSTDRTVEIARNLGARVFEESWTGDFAYHRNRCQDRCSNDWVFFIDGDEDLQDVGDIEERLQTGGCDGLAMTIRCVVNGRVEEELVAIRLYDRTRARWKYAVHEQLLGLEEVVSTRALLMAEYDRSFEASTRTRLDRLLRHAAEVPDDSHYAFFVARSYRSLHDFESVVKWAGKYLRLDSGEPREAEVLVWLVEAALHEGDFDRARTVLDAALKRHPNYPDLLHLQVTLAVYRWWEASSLGDPRYVAVSRRTSQYVDNLEQAIELLGLPLGIVDDGAP